MTHDEQDLPAGAPGDAAALEAAARAEDARARRAALKAARAAIPPPERDHAYDHLGLDQLRDLRASLADAETKASYWRRIISARLDDVRARDALREPVADLRGVLAEADTAIERLGRLDVAPVAGLEPLPDLVEVWARPLDAGDEPAAEALAGDLAHVERRLSDHRDEVLRRAELVTRELIARYREEPLLALQALPGDPLGRTVLG